MRTLALAGAVVATLISAAVHDAAGETTTPVAGPGFDVNVLPVELEIGSGVAEFNGDLLFTDLGTGRVLRWSGSNVTVVATLPIGTDVMGYPTGPYKLGSHSGRLLVSQGWQDVNRDEGPNDHAIISIEPGGAIQVISRDFWNPYDFEAAGTDLLIADSGKNTLFRLSPNGELTEHFVFPRLVRDTSALQELSPTEFQSGETYEVDAVPTGVAVGRDVVHVALFGGFPFPDGGGRVVAIPLARGDPQARIEVSDLNAPTDVALDRDGRLLVLEFGRFEPEKGVMPGSGRLLRIDLSTGERTVVLEGLTQPATVLPLAAGGYIVTQMGGPALRVSPR